MRPLGVRLAGTAGGVLAAAALFVGAGAASTGADRHFVEARVVGSGSAVADYGEDRKQPGLTTASGVDGRESIEWRWEVRAVAVSTGAGPLVTRAKSGRLRGVLTTSLVSYAIQMGKVGEEPLCDFYQGTTTFLSNDGAGRIARRSGSGELVHNADFRLRGGQLNVSPPRGLTRHSCFHGPTGDRGLDFVEGVGAGDAPVPRGAFNPRSDRSYERIYRSGPVDLGRSHGSDLNSAHTFTGQSRLAVKLHAISERRFNKLVKRYQHLPVNLPGSGEKEYHEPPARSP
jgi:hypothetical protein